MLLAQAASAQDYPAKSVRLIAAAAPGGNPDVLARMLAAKLAESFGRPFVVENVPGAGGVVAAEAVARSAPDGYVLMLGDSGAMAINVALNPKVPYHPLKDFTLITALAAVPTVLVANPSVPAASLQDFVFLAKGQPGKFSYGSAGNGSVHHLTMAVFASRAGLDMLHVPYKGGTALVAAVLSGEVQSGWSGIPNVLAHIRAGKLKVYAISTAQRSSTLPDVPTAAEAGIKGYTSAAWFAFLGPRGTPRPIVDKVYKDVAAAMADPIVRNRFIEFGAEPLATTPEQLGKYISSEIVKWRDIITKAGITLEQ